MKLTCILESGDSRQVSELTLPCGDPKAVFAFAEQPLLYEVRRMLEDASRGELVTLTGILS